MGDNIPGAPINQQQWQQQVMQQYDPQGYQQQMTEQQRMSYEIDQAMHQASAEVAQGVNLDLPFENVPEPQPQVQAQPEVQQPTQQFGAPVNAESPKQEDPLAHVQPQNPWDTPENRAEIEIFNQHKQRLNIAQDKDLLPHVREYFKNENASISDITPDQLKGFNAYLQNIQA